VRAQKYDPNNNSFLCTVDGKTHWIPDGALMKLGEPQFAAKRGSSSEKTPAVSKKKINPTWRTGRKLRKPQSAVVTMSRETMKNSWQKSGEPVPEESSIEELRGKRVQITEVDEENGLCCTILDVRKVEHAKFLELSGKSKLQGQDIWIPDAALIFLDKSRVYESGNKIRSSATKPSLRTSATKPSLRTSATKPSTSSRLNTSRKTYSRSITPNRSPKKTSAFSYSTRSTYSSKPSTYSSKPSTSYSRPLPATSNPRKPIIKHSRPVSSYRPKQIAGSSVSNLSAVISLNKRILEKELHDMPQDLRNRLAGKKLSITQKGEYKGRTHYKVFFENRHFWLPDAVCLLKNGGRVEKASMTANGYKPKIAPRTTATATRSYKGPDKILKRSPTTNYVLRYFDTLKLEWKKCGLPYASDQKLKSYVGKIVLASDVNRTQGTTKCVLK